ncbi:MAG TPA: recombinase family protein [Candidatus Baltobacteraceae bacterium]|nr:recombinase family protein [Candidatus Baltobacteraceae bacterium]
MARRTRKQNNKSERKIVAYARCSTDEQATNGTSIESQTSRIEQYAGAMGFEITEMISDPGFSAKSLLRPGMGQILQGIACGEIGVVVVLKLDRLTRSIADLQNLLALCEKHDVRMISVCESLDTESAAGRLVVNVLGTFAQFEREIIAERTAMGLTTKRRKGHAYGRTPFGFRRVDDRLVPDADAQAALVRVRTMYDDGASYACIADWLNEQSIATPQGGKTWYAASVRKLCLSKAFTEGVGAVGQVA